MRKLVIGDIHSGLKALEQVLEKRLKLLRIQNFTKQYSKSKNLKLHGISNYLSLENYNLP